MCWQKPKQGRKSTASKTVRQHKRSKGGRRTLKPHTARSASCSKVRHS